MKNLISIGLAFFLILTLSAHPTQAATIHVPADYATIQGAIDSAVDGDMVLVSSGTYFENIDFLRKGIILLGESGAENTVIDGGLCTSGENSCSVVTFGYVPETAVLDGFTITNGIGTDVVGKMITGGGIYCHHDSKPTIANCIITGNSAFRGGGIGTEFGGNLPVIKNCIIRGNHGSEGGGIRVRGAATIIQCTITGNSSSRTGVGFHCKEDECSATITNSILWGDEAPHSPFGNEIFGEPVVSYSIVEGGFYNGPENLDRCIRWI